METDLITKLPYIKGVILIKKENNTFYHIHFYFPASSSVESSSMESMMLVFLFKNGLVKKHLSQAVEIEVEIQQ